MRINLALASDGMFFQELVQRLKSGHHLQMPPGSTNAAGEDGGDGNNVANRTLAGSMDSVVSSLESSPTVLPAHLLAGVNAQNASTLNLAPDTSPLSPSVK